MVSSYQTYRGLPALAGIATIDEAAQPGLEVDACVRRLKRYHFAFKRLHGIFTAHITAEPVYELKMSFSLHAYLCSEHTAALRQRIGEMREPPLGLDKVPDPYLAVFFDEILATPATEERLLGLYEKALPALIQGIKRHLAETNHLADYPSVRLCKFALFELEEMQTYAAEAIACLISPEQRTTAEKWLVGLDSLLNAAGQLDGTSPTNQLDPPWRHYSKQPFRYPNKPRRDSRFPDPYNMGVNAEAFLYDKTFAPEPKTLMMFFKRLREIDVPEMMASIIVETSNKPWNYYRDMTRQLWDEARHAMMGEVGFAAQGIDWRTVMVNFTWSLALNTQLKPLERHSVLYFIEQGLMPRNGKRFEWEVGLASNNPLAAHFQDYDWADEVLHARIGRDWYVSEIGDVKQAVAFGDACWSRVLMDWEQWRRDGLTEHRNWWPELYRQACARWETKPDQAVLGFETSYQNLRPDLKNISASA